MTLPQATTCANSAISATFRHDQGAADAPRSAAPAPDGRPPDRPAPRFTLPTYLECLTWAFTLFNSVRVLSYLPTLWAIHQNGDSSQHSLWTWCTWLGANVTMAAWLYEHNGKRLNKAVAVNIGNAVMCAATIATISFYRL